MLKVLEDLKSQPITEAEVARARVAINKQIELATNDTAQLTIALTESMAAGDWRLFFLERDRIEKTTRGRRAGRGAEIPEADQPHAGRFIPTDTVDRTEVPGKPDIAALVDGYKGRAMVAQGEAFDPSPANIEARTERFTLPNGLKGALLPKKTKGGMVSANLVLRTGTAEA